MTGSPSDADSQSSNLPDDQLDQPTLDDVLAPPQPQRQNAASATGQPISVILNSPEEDRVSPGDQLQLSVIICHRGQQRASIDVFLDDLPPTLAPWCPSIQEKLVLDVEQSGEVVFSFTVPNNALPGIYTYWLVVEAPLHYPQSPPLRYAQSLQVLPSVHSTAQGHGPTNGPTNGPTFVLQPTTSAPAPASLAPGSTLALQLMVYNRADRVDRFRLLCSDLPAPWLQVHYPQGGQASGLAVAEDYLDLNPGEQGVITLQITPPLDALAGSYVPTLRLRSENRPELSLMDPLYLEILPLYQVDLQLITLTSRVRRKPGQFQVQAINRGNTARSLLLSILERDGGDQCTYALAPEQLDLEPQQTLTSDITVRPKFPRRRPFWGGGQLLNFGVKVEDKAALPLPDVPLQGYILWEARPWWQLLPFILLGIGGLVGLILCLWWWLLRPPATPQVLRLATTDNQYAALAEDAVRLNFQVSYPYQIEAMEIIGQSPEGEVISGPMIYDFSDGVPPDLRANCAVERRQMTCTNLRTDALMAGDYIFQLTVVPKPGRGRTPSQLITPLVSILPAPLPEIVGFAPTQPNYLEALPSALPADDQGAAVKGEGATANATGGADGMVRLNWAIANPNNLLALEIIGRNTEGAIVMPPLQFDWRNGIPEGLTPFCQWEQGLICQGIPTGVNQAGDYTFDLTILARSGPTETPIRETTEVVKIVPRPPQILSFLINGNEAQPKYLLPIAPGQSPPQISLTWAVAATPGTQIMLNPSPGTIPPQGSMVVPLSPEPGETVFTLQVTNSAGDQTTRSVTIETYNPNPQGPDTIVVGGDQQAGSATAGSGSAAADQTESDLSAPTPSQPGQLSPSEVPPQFN